MPSTIRVLAGVPVPMYVLRDSAYPLLPWFMTGTGLSSKKQKFNRLSRAHVLVECAFKWLKGRWRSLLKQNDTCIDHMTTLITVCCVLQQNKCFPVKNTHGCALAYCTCSHLPTGDHCYNIEIDQTMTPCN